MKSHARLGALVLALITAALATASAAGTPDTYRVTVTRTSSDLYRVDGTKVYIKTKFCYEFVFSEEAVLRYTRYAFDNKLIFDKRNPVVSCDVEKVLTED